MLSQSQVEDVVGVRREIVVLLALQLEALDSPQGLTEAKLMECYQRQTRVQELRDQLQAISDLKEAQLGFQNDAERSFRAAKEVNPIHAGAQRIAGGELGGVGHGDGRNVEIHRLAAAVFDDAAIHQRHA